MELKEYLLALMDRGDSGNCDDTELLRKHKEGVMSCEDVEVIISAFWVALEDVYNMDELEETILIKKIAKNIIEQSL